MLASTFPESAYDFQPRRGYRNELLYSVERLVRASPVSKGNFADSRSFRLEQEKLVEMCQSAFLHFDHSLDAPI